jgi:transformation/transcription domain-associated protein
LVAVRHILATDLRQAFVSQFETLLDDELLFGIGYTSSSVMRPLVFSTMADLVHHIRLDLSSNMIIRVIDIYARCFHDPSLPYGIQTMSAKLLLNLMDCVNSDKIDVDLRRPLSMKILSILLRKYSRMAKVVEEINIRKFDPLTKNEKPFDMFWEDPLKSRVICSDSISADSGKDNIRDIKFVLKTVTAGVKSIILSFKTNYISFNPDTDPPVHPANAFSNSCNFTLEESRLFIDMFHDGVACFDICQSEVLSSTNGSNSSLTSISAEDKELVDQFAYIFTLLDPYIFQDVLSAHLEYLFERIVKNPLLLIIPQYFLAINTVSRNFAGVLIKFLVEKFETIGDNSAQSNALLRLFKLIFLAVSVYPDENEQMILPYISDIILNCLRLSQKSSNPVNFFLILKALFRGIAGGRFEHLYKEVLPILPLLLESLNKLVTSSTDRQMQDLYVELCLTTPVRLSVLLPYLPFLMKPLVLSLTSETELVNQGLRTLELCVDNLTQDFLEPIIAPVLPDLLNALWSLLRNGSSNQPQSQFALRILGKFGGRGRRFLKYPLKLEYVESKSSGISLIFDPLPESDKLLELPLDTLIDICHDFFCVPIAKPFDGLDKDHVFSILCSCLSSICGFDILKAQSFNSERLQNIPFVQDNEIKFSYDEENVCARLNNQSKSVSTFPNSSILSANFKKLLSALFFIKCNSENEHSRSAKSILENICDRFVVIQILAQRNQAKDYSFSGLTPNVFLEVFAEIICGPIETQMESALELLSRIHEKLSEVTALEKISELPLFFLLVEKLIAYCYGSEFYRKIGACHGLGILFKFSLGARWMWMQESRIVRGLLFILKDVPAYASETQTKLVSNTLLDFLKLCHSNKDMVDPELKSKSQYYFNQNMSILISELTNSNSIVRDVVHSCFELLSECNGCEVGELLTPHRDRLLLPIFTKPLRALPFSLQIGYVDAVNYCLNLKPPLVNFSEELLRLLHEALALVEADDTALVSKSGQLKNAQNLINLRVVCISLLSTAISCSEFQDPKMHQIRNHIVSAFFKSLYSKAPEIVSVARKGLELVILHQQKLPKDLLQHGLRPVLINLAEAKRLTLSGLEGLSKVLQLLTSYFKAEIGKKLLDHVSVWADQKLLEDLSGKPLLESMDIKIIVAILDVFHLLPPSANLFLEDLIVTVQKLDTWTKRTISSPFRPALYKFMYKHPVDSVTYLLNHFESAFYTELFVASLKSDEGIVLLQELNRPENMTIFLEKFFLNRINLDRVVRISALKILIAAMKRLNSKFSSIQKVKDVIDAFFSGTAPLDMNKEIISSSGEECEFVLDMAFCCLSLSALDVEILVHIVAALDSSAACLDVTWVPRDIRDFCKNATNKKDVILSCMDSMNSTTISLSAKARIIRCVLLPSLVIAKDQGLSLSKIAGAQFIQKLEKFILNRDCSNLESSANILSLEELQLVCLILSFDSASTDLKSISTPLRRFLVARNSSPDPVIRYSALFAACFFIGEMSADIKLIDPIIKSALNIPTSEVRPLLRQTLSYALPCLLKRASSEFLKSWLPEILSDLSKNSHFLTVIAVFWSNFIQLEQELCVYQDILIRPLITCLSKAALSVFSVQEHRSYPFEIARIILNWLKTDYASIEDIYIEQFIHTIIKVCMLFTDGSPESKQFTSDGLELLHSISDLLRRKSRAYKLRYEYFVRSLPPQIEASEDAITSSNLFVKIILTISANRDDGQLVTDFENLQRFLHYCLTSCNDKLVIEVCPLLARTCHIKSEKFDELSAALQHFILESLQNSRALFSTFTILNTLISNDAPITENNLAAFLRTFQKICTEHVARIDQNGDVAMDEGSVSAFANSFLIPPMKFAVSTFCNPSSQSKFIVYNALKMIWENSMSSDALIFIIEKIHSWFNEDGEIADFKERADIISTPSKLFELHDENLMSKYLELILTIYSSPRLRTTDLTMKLEGSFLFGLCYSKKEIRSRFFKLIDELIPRKVEDRIIFVFSSQRWNLVASLYWISFAIEFILAAWPRELRSVSCLSWPKFHDISFESRALFKYNIENIFITFDDLIYNSNDACHKLWLQIFPQIWNSLSISAREELSDCIIKVLAEPDFTAAALFRPNSMKTILDGLALLEKMPDIPKNLVSYIGSEFGAWHSACVILENNLSSIKKATKSHDYAPIKDLCQLFDRLGETEMSSGLIRRFSIFPETNIALSFEQNNYWMTAQKIFEKAQIKARNGTIPFFEDEFIVWESHWENCAKKLQQWDLLSEIAKVDNNTNLSLECEWVLNDWSRTETKNHIEGLLGQVKESTRQKKLMESFIVLNQLKEAPEKLAFFQNSMENLVLEMMTNWSQLPELPSSAHCSALEQLQIIVEVQESQSFFANASNSLNRPQFLQELKALLSTWRDRLPNNWEDTGVWSSLLAWRQHVFTAINSVFHTSPSGLSTDASGASNSQNSHPFAYRGYHETAWLINRFAHVARKNNMFDVSLSFLNKIYTLPNIEIQDAFLKLREQAKCYMENPIELPTALEVINATNLNYFNNTQKAEFFTLKAIVLSRLGMIDEANRIFAQAVQIDLNIAKGWSSWGYFNDQRFQQSKDITFGVNAVNCYLQAATLCKNVNSRKYLTRVLWLLTFEDSAGSMSKSFELYNHDLPSWYWVPFISELLTSLNRREARQARFLLMKIAKSYPQALYLQLRTVNEEYKLLNISPAGSSTPVQGESTETKFTTNSPNPTTVSDSNGMHNLSEKTSISDNIDMESNSSEQPFFKKPPHEHTDDLIGILKTGYPLLALSLENMVEHIIHRLRSSPEEDLYRIITTLITENIQVRFKIVLYNFYLFISKRWLNLMLTLVTKAHHPPPF